MQREYDSEAIWPSLGMQPLYIHERIPGEPAVKHIYDIYLLI